MRVSKEKMAKARKVADAYDRVAHHNSLSTSHTVTEEQEIVKKKPKKETDLPPPELTAKELVARLVKRLEKEVEEHLRAEKKYHDDIRHSRLDHTPFGEGSWKATHAAGVKVTRTREALEIIAQEMNQ